MGAIGEEKQEQLESKLYDSEGEEQPVPTIKELKRHFAVLLDEFMYRVRDKIDNGNVQEVALLVDATQHIDQISYAIDSLNPDKVEHFINRSELEGIVDKAVEKVHEKLQGEEKSAVARKLKLDAALKAKTELSPEAQAIKDMAI